MKYITVTVNWYQTQLEGHSGLWIIFAKWEKLIKIIKILYNKCSKKIKRSSPKGVFLKQFIKSFTETERMFCFVKG